jgi:hypothetical protein
MKKTLLSLALVSIMMISGCAKNDQPKEKDTVQGKEASKIFTIVANGYGESKEKAVDDAKNDALRQFGFNIVTGSGGKPELVYAGRISEITILKEYTEELKNGMWWEVKVEAGIEKF